MWTVFLTDVLYDNEPLTWQENLFPMNHLLDFLIKWWMKGIRQSNEKGNVIFEEKEIVRDQKVGFSGNFVTWRLVRVYPFTRLNT